jgi:hypothetical protein
MKNKFTLIGLAILFSLNAMAQKDVYLTIRHMLGTSPLAFNQAASNDLGNNFSITRIDYYLSQFTIIHDGGMETTVPSGRYILAKGNANVVINLGNFNVTNVEGIKFHIGVEAPTNNADPAQWIAPHPLAPQSPSMHWGWASGYRFVALEGKAGANLSTTYEMHGLGNANYFVQTVTTPGFVNGNNIYINLDANYVEAVRGIDLSTGPIAHGVDGADLDVLKNFRDHVFTGGPGFAASVSDQLQANDLLLYPNPSNGQIQVLIPSLSTQQLNVRVLDVQGRMVQEFQVNNNNAFQFFLDVKGVYTLQIQSESQGTIYRKLLIE